MQNVMTANTGVVGVPKRTKTSRSKVTKFLLCDKEIFYSTKMFLRRRFCPTLWGISSLIFNSNFYWYVESNVYCHWFSIILYSNMQNPRGWQKFKKCIFLLFSLISVCVLVVCGMVNYTHDPFKLLSLSISCWHCPSKWRKKFTTCLHEL